jgi:N-acetylneuraminic acid mutarotase
MQRFLVLLTIVLLASALAADCPDWAGPAAKSLTRQVPSNPSTFGMIWSTWAPAPTPGRYWCPGSGMLRDTIYLLGGRADLGGGNTNSTNQVIAYVPAADTWLMMPPLAQYRRAGGGGLIDSIVYVAGGRDTLHTTLTTCEAYNLNTKTSTMVASMPGSGCWACASAVAGGKLYIIDDENASGACYEYDPVANAWAAKAPMPLGRGWTAAAGAAGQVYLMGGSGDYADMWEFDPVGNAWSQKADMPGGRIYHSAFAWDDSVIYVVGGQVGGVTDGAVYRYSIAGNSWTTETPMPTARGWLMPIQYNRSIYAMCGSDCNTPTYLTVNERADFLDHDVLMLSVTPTGSTPPGTPVDFTGVVKNQGSSGETFPVHYEVYDSIAGSNVIDVDTTVTLAAGDTLAIVFGNVTPASGNVYLTEAYTALVGDQMPSNDTLHARTAVRIGSAPDGFGYVYETTQNPGDTVTYSWVDPTGGTAITDWLGTRPGDDGYSIRALPFTFPYYDQDLTSINVCSNGFLETSILDPFTNTTFPAAVTNMIAPFWDDMDPGTGGTVYQYDDPAGHYTVFGFIGVLRYNTSEAETFEVIIDDQGRIKYNYQTMTGILNSNTVGIQGILGASNWYHQYVSDGTPSEHVVGDSVGILFYYPPYLGVAEPRGAKPEVARLRIPTPCNRTALALPAELGTGAVGLYNLTGQLVQSVQLDGSSRELSLAGLGQGLYFVKLQTPGHSETHKLLIAR